MRTGDVVDGRYAILERAGVGGVGSVYRALDRQTNTLVAFKVLHVPHATAQARFVTEARALAGLEHPHIVRYVTHGISSDGEPYLVMEWLDGESLDRRLSRERLSIDDSVDLARRIASALGAAHARGIVHRDVKPSNVLLVDNALDKPRLLDFGIARLDEATGGLTRTGNVLGTPGYMAPEQARGDKRYIDPRADVFSLGCVLFECLTGQPPFHGPHAMAVIMKLLSEDAPRLRTVRPDAPEALEGLVARMLAREPLSRFMDGQAVVNALDMLGSLKTIEPQPMSVRRRMSSSAEFYPPIPPAAAAPVEATLAMAPTMMGVSSLRELTDRYNSDRPSSPPPEPRSPRRDSVPPPPPSVPPPSRVPSALSAMNRSPATMPPSSVSTPGTVPPPSDRRWYERLPRAPGRSPFHVKGLAYKGLLHFVTTKIAGGIHVLAASMRDAGLRDYITQTFLASTFYDVLPLVSASAATATLTNTALETFAQNQGRAQAKYDADHAYRAFVQGRSIDDFPSRCKLIASRYYDFGEWEANSFSPGTITFVARGIPAWAAPWFGPLLSGYASTLVQYVAKKNASATLYPVRRDGANDGVQTVIVEMDISF